MLSILRRLFGPSRPLIPAVTVGAAVSLLVMGLSMAVYNEGLGRAEKLREVTVQADILARSVTASLAFDDSSVAKEYVQALGANPDVQVAAVYDLKGKPVAVYARPGSSWPATNRAGRPSLEGDRIAVSRIVSQGPIELGSVYLRTVREPLVRRAARYAGIGMLIVMAALILVVLGAWNSSQLEIHRKLTAETAERERAERELRLSREKEAAARIEAEAQRSRAAILQSEQQLQFALDAGELGSWALDLATGLVTGSKFYWAGFGLGPDTVLKREELDRYIHPDDRERQRGARERAIRDSTGLETEFRTVSPSGERRWILTRGRIVHGEDGSAQSLAGVSLDITARMTALAERQAVEEQLRQAQKVEAIGQLTGGIAHDFNNLLGVIIGNLDLLLDTLRSAPDQAQLGQEALEAALRGAELTKRLLAFARQQPLETRMIDLNERLPGMAALLQRTLGEGIDVRTSLARGLWLARADPSQVEDALLNLAINARDAMPDGGELTIESANVVLDEDFAAKHLEVAPGEYVMLSVTDTGAGMPAEVVARATEPFYTTKPPGKGTGLGLSMIYGFAKQSRGHLSIYSEPGVGTTIRLYLPRARDEDAPKEVAGARAPGEPPQGVESILVVDDNPQLRQVAARRLTALGYRCVEADNGPEALAILERGERFDLLFTDVGLPEGLTGFELAELAKQRQPWLRVLFTSGYAKAQSRLGEDQPAFQQMLRKPYRGDELATKVRDTLDSMQSA